MTFARSALMVVIAMALASYGFDCPVTSSSDEAMQCCDTMACSAQGHQHSDDCCKTMPSTHSPFVKTYSSQNTHVAFVLFAVLPVLNGQALDFSSQSVLTASANAPPVSQGLTQTPLRI
jgi:hypothetical protein